MWVGLAQLLVSVAMLVAVAAPARAQEESTPEIVVRVVAGETDEPLPGIALRMEWFPPEPPKGRERPKVIRTENVQADGEGVVRIEAPTERVAAKFSDEELAGWLDFGPDTGEATLRLLPPHTVFLRIVDAKGRSLPGLPVRLNVPNRFRTRTDAAGLAVVPNARFLVPPYEHPDLAAEVVLDETQHAPIRVPFQVVRLPHGPVTVELPEAPSLTVNVGGALRRPPPPSAPP